MIVRIWHGVTKENVAETYAQYIRETGIPMYRSHAGNRGVYLLRRIEDGKAEFCLFSFWDSYKAIEAFAGRDIGRAKYFDKDENYLIEMEPFVKHYEVLDKPGTLNDDSKICSYSKYPDKNIHFRNVRF